MSELSRTITLLSRRAFLQRSAFAALAMRFGLPGGAFSQQNVTFPARAFGLTSVYDRPGGAVVGSLAPDSVHLVQSVNEWFITEHGYVPRTAMQPIRSYTPPTIESHAVAPFWAELIAPSSVVRAWCDARAPVQVTFGHGAVVYVRGTLTDDHGSVWYELDRGWVTAAHFARIALTPNPSPAGGRGESEARCDLSKSSNGNSLMYIGNRLNASSSPMQWERGSGGGGFLRLYTGQQLILRSWFYGGATLLPTLTELVQPEAPGDSSGLPWQMRLSSGVIMRGAWDHNRFGLPGGGTDVELLPEVAKAVYAVVLENQCTVQIET